MRRIWVILSACLLATGIGLAVTAPGASATGYGNQWCYEASGGLQACLDAWGGGPRVNVEIYRNVSYDENFTLIWNSYYQADELELTNGGNYSGQCLGDYGNTSSSASSGLVSCGFNGGAGWGALWYYSTPAGCPSNYYVFQNIHWSQVFGKGAYLSPGSMSDGDHFYNTNNVGYCFGRFGPKP